MKILITGTKVQLGTQIIKMLESMNSELGPINNVYKYAEVIRIDGNQLDITNLNQVREYISKAKPEVIINCALTPMLMPAKPMKT